MANLRTNNLCGEGGTNAYRGSVFFDGTGDKLSVPNSADIRLGSNDFTIEAWVKFGDVSGYWETIIGMWDTSANRETFTLARYKNGGQTNDGDLYLSVSSDGSSDTHAHGSNDSKIVLSINHWHHVAGVRDGNTLRVYINGIQVGTGSFSSSVYNNTTDALFIGDAESGDTRNMNGFISNLRLVNGTCLYPSGTTFTPPTEELTAVENTVLLCCQDSDDPTQEATGKTITAAGNLTDVDYVKMQPKVIPPYGVDAGNIFDGAISMNTPSYMYFPTGRTEERGRGRAVIMGGVQSSPSNPYMNQIDFFTVTTLGNSMKFGELSFGSREGAGAVSSTNRAIYAGGMGPSSEVATNSMSFITISTQGNGTDYGDLTATKRQGEGCSNGVRGLFMGGENDTPSTNTYNDVIDYCTIASVGNALDFGNLTAARDGGGACSSPTRGVYAGGFSNQNLDIIDYVTIATTGNATDFGDMTFAHTQGTGCSNATRGLFFGGRAAPTNYNSIEFITIASTGDATDFGDLSSTGNQANATASQTRGVHVAGNPASAPLYQNNTMSFVTIASTGDASDFGDVYAARSRRSTSDCHGGLS